MAAPKPKPTGRRQLSRQPASLLYAIKRLELVVRAHLEELLKPSGITALQYTALTVLEQHDGVPAAQLARNSFVTAQSMADMVHGLEERGLVHRERNPANRRELLVHLSDAGRKVLADNAEAVADLERRLAAPLTGKQVDGFRSALTETWRALA
ncbi:MarR family transcriptional regulator [Amycolatopsis rhizosphaerae]|uniref:MarR family transcriptional regulator n=1 Tax=Amycolatopsis rhizosphaerae TaxID=2053003 RepID=A0A558CSX7_9PSEU|nr:MarR family transcriptional regulator [Amycolatopsis rhizosphaerae]TVT51846.1 MarR family transcriptional regulator [Amycolatopsis rhizosphaerae]